MIECKYCNKNFKSDISLKQHVKVKHGTIKTRLKKKIKHQYKKLLIATTIIITILTGYNLLNTPGPYDEFATCLTLNGFIIAGTDTCTACNNQKKLFGKSFYKLNYKNCAYTDWCNLNNIEGYPTWVLPDNTLLVGVQELSTLSELSGCEL